MTILYAHGLYDHDMARQCNPPASRVMAAEVFQRNIETLASAFTVISLGDAVEMVLNAKAFARNAVVITFDDSLKSLARIAAPMLFELGIPATFFVSTQAIDHHQEYWFDRVESIFRALQHGSPPLLLPNGEMISSGDKAVRLQTLKEKLRDMPSDARDLFVEEITRVSGFHGAANPHSEVMEWEDVRQLHVLGMEVGSHTVTHANLTKVSGAALELELNFSKQQIELIGGQPCKHLAYPYGRHSKDTASAARKAGYVSALTTMAGSNPERMNPFVLRRCHMPREAHQLAFLMLTQKLTDHRVSCA